MILRRYFENLSIGSKMAFGSALTAFFFLLALGQYHLTLSHTLEHHQEMLTGQNSRGIPVRHIQNQLLEARRNEKIFVLQKDTHAGQLALERVHLAIVSARELQTREADPGIRQRLGEILKHLENYELALRDLQHTWEVMGLNHGSGLQGHFRAEIHQVEESLHTLSENPLRAALARLHHAERDLLLFKGEEYSTAVKSAVEGVREAGEEAYLEPRAKQRLVEMLDRYLVLLTPVTEGKGIRERDAAEWREILEEIDTLVHNRLVPDLSSAMLEMRRREKDFLLRGEDQYVEMVRNQLRLIIGAISSSYLEPSEKQRLVEALARYEGDFMALAEHTRHVKVLEKQLQESAVRIESLTNTQLMEVDNATQDMVRKIREKSTEGAILAILLVAVAVVNGAFFVYFISTRITRPVAEMISMTRIYSRSWVEPTPGEEAETTPAPISPVENRNRDEIRLLAETMEQMSTHLREVVQLVDAQAEGLDCSSQELMESSVLLNQCSEEIQSRATLMDTEPGGMLRRWGLDLKAMAQKSRKRAQGLSAKARQLNHILDRIQW